MTKRGWLGAAMACALSLIGVSAASGQNYPGDHHVLRFGVFGQGAFVGFDQTQPLNGSTQAAGIQGGLSVGIDFHPQKYWLWGIELDAAFGDTRDHINTTAGTVNYGVDYLANLRGRFGVYADPRWLIYGTGGLSFLGFEAGAPLLSNQKAAETRAGLTVGFGTEFQWHHVSLFGEYNYANFGSREFTLGTVRHEADADVHMLRFGIKFNVGHAHESGLGRHYDPMK